MKAPIRSSFLPRTRAPAALFRGLAALSRGLQRRGRPRQSPRHARTAAVSWQRSAALQPLGRVTGSGAAAAAAPRPGPFDSDRIPKSAADENVGNQRRIRKNRTSFVNPCSDRRLRSPFRFSGYNTLTLFAFLSFEISACLLFISSSSPHVAAVAVFLSLLASSPLSAAAPDPIGLLLGLTKRRKSHALLAEVHPTSQCNTEFNK
ncbi:hypothetical protein Cni_G18793 [Canna indica]|uniref:Uncharacterized protein n=1 Tax=Canna indica TaxID=4628 RepID=A0AAQ3KL20_9LILI|nr:hypothetical protein Cni_G18793 [Canna indica]